MKSYEKKGLVAAFGELGILRGDVLYVSSSLFQLGPMVGAKTSDQLCKAILDAIFEQIGREGTIVVPTFTTTLGRSGEPFILEETPTSAGIFSEYIRTHPDSIRSLHPIHSVAAIGRRAEDICSDASPSSYAIESPSFRLYEMDAKAVTIGADRPFSGWVHLLEVMHAVPYIYNKVLDIDVYVNSKKVEREFYAPVCYLDFDIEYDIVQAEIMISETGAVHYADVGNGKVSCVSSSDYFKAGNRILLDDPYVFLKRNPKFRHGEIPFDGITGGREAGRKF